MKAITLYSSTVQKEILQLQRTDMIKIDGLIKDFI